MSSCQSFSAQRGALIRMATGLSRFILEVYVAMLGLDQQSFNSVYGS